MRKQRKNQFCEEIKIGNFISLHKLSVTLRGRYGINALIILFRYFASFTITLENYNIFNVYDASSVKRYKINNRK